MAHENTQSPPNLGDLEPAIKSVKLDYSDALYDSQNELVIRKNKDRETTSSRSNQGVSFRGFSKNGWVYSNSNRFERNTIRRLVGILNRYSSLRVDGKLNLPDPVKIEKETTVKRKPSDVSLDDKLLKVRELFKTAKGLDPRIADVRVSYAESQMKRLLVTSRGTQASQTVTRTRIGMQVIVKENDVTEWDRINLGGTVGYEVVDYLSEDLMKETVASAVEQLSATSAPPGPQTVILEPGVVGTVCHESFGHGLEADQAIRGRSYLSGLLGEKVASDLVTIYEDSSLQGGHGSYIFDDDGAISRKNTLVENGILVNFLQDVETSAAMNAPLTASSRTQNAARRRFIRMSNTYARPGESSLEDMVKETRKGIMLMRWLFGIEDPLGGGMQVSAKKGYLIENGQKTKPIKSVTLTGRVLEILGAVDAVSKEGFMTDPGNCGKGHEDLVPVGSGGTWWRTKAVIA